MLRVIQPSEAVPARALGWDAARAEAWSGPLTTLAVAVAVFGLAYDNGTFSVGARSTLGIAVWWTLLLLAVLALVPVLPAQRAARAVAAATLGLALLALVAVTGAPGAAPAVHEAGRAAVAAGLFLLVAALARRSHAARWCGGLAVAVAAVTALALAARFFPD